MVDKDTGTEGCVYTEWSSKTQTPTFETVTHGILLTQKQISIDVEAMVKGEAKVIASGVLDGGSLQDLENGECNLSIGTIKFTQTTLMKPVNELLGTAQNGSSVTGLSISCSIPGDHHTVVEKQFDEISVRVAESEHDTLIGKGKLGARRNSLFLQLHSSNIDLYKRNGVYISIGESDKMIKIPCCADTFTTAVSIKDAEGKPLILMITAHLLADVSLCSGVINSLDMFSDKKSGFNEKEREKYNSTQLIYMNLKDTSSSDEISSENDARILAKCMEYPFKSDTSEYLEDLQVNGTFCIIPKVHSKDKKSAEVTNKILHLHKSTLSISDEMRKNSSCGFEIMVIDLEWELTDSNDVKLLEKKIGRRGLLKEVGRKDNANEGNTITLEGELKSDSSTAISMRAMYTTLSSNQPEKVDPDFESDDESEKSLSNKSSKESLINDPPLEVDPVTKNDEVPYGHSEVARENSLPELKQSSEPSSPQSSIKDPLKRANQPDEMPGLSQLEDIAHEGSLNELYESFGTLFDDGQDENVDIIDDNIGGNMSPKAMLSHKRATKAGTALAQVIKAELIEKQRIINRLLDEATARSEAIDLCGNEIRGLRKEVIEWKDVANEANQEIKKTEHNIATASKFVENTVGSPEELSSLNRATLIHIVLDLGDRLKKSDEERIKLKKIVMEGQSARSMYLESQQHLSDLTEAHLHQSHFIQKLQKKISKMDNYKSTIKLQESIIGKMQKVVEAHLKLSRREGAGNQNDLLDKLIYEIESSEKQTSEEKSSSDAIRKNEMTLKIKEQELAKAKREIEMLENDNKALREANIEASKTQLTDVDRENMANKEVTEELEVEITTQGYRISALEEQLELSAQDHAREVARLRTKLFDLEMAAMLAEVDDDDVDDHPTIETEKTMENVESAVSIAASEKSDTTKPSYFEHDEVILPIKLLSNNKEVLGICDVGFKFKYAASIEAPLKAENEVELIITKLTVKEYQHDPEKEMKQFFLDLTFVDDFKAKTEPKDATDPPVNWDTSNDTTMSFITTFGKASTENMLVVAMIYDEDKPNVLFASGHDKLISIEEAKTVDAEDHEHEDVPAENTDGSNDPDESQPSPRPVPTGKLHRNMAVLNAALGIVGKVASYMDVDENVDNKRQMAKSEKVTGSNERILPEGLEI